MDWCLSCKTHVTVTVVVMATQNKCHSLTQVDNRDVFTGAAKLDRGTSS